jgi:hypothetical protein
MKLLGIINVDFHITGQRLIRAFIFVRYCRKSGSIMVHPSAFYNFKKAYDSVRMEALYNTIIEFGVPRKLVGLIKIWSK